MEEIQRCEQGMPISFAKVNILNCLKTYTKKDTQIKKSQGLIVVEVDISIPGVSFEAGERRNWPDLVIKPRLNSPELCYTHKKVIL